MCKNIKYTIEIHQKLSLGSGTAGCNFFSWGLGYLYRSSFEHRNARLVRKINENNDVEHQVSYVAVEADWGIKTLLKNVQ